MSTTTSSAVGGSCSTGSCVGRKELSEDAIDQELHKLSPGVWKLSYDKKKISIGFTTRSWSKAIAVINELSVLAESEAISHHPDIQLTEYRVLEVVIWTHAVGGLTMSDFILAAAIENLRIDFSPKWLQSHPEFAHMNLAYLNNCSEEHAVILVIECRTGVLSRWFGPCTNFRNHPKLRELMKNIYLL